MVLSLEAAAWQACAERSPILAKPRRWASPLDMAAELGTGIVRTPALERINQSLVRVADAPGQARLAVFMSPQEGKSSTCSYWNLLWLLVNNPDLRIILVSYNAEKAREWGADIKLAVENFNGDDGMTDLGIRLRADSRAAGRWKIEGRRGGLYCAGIEGGITGRPGDYIVVDDPHKNMQEAQSSAKRDSVTHTYRGAIIPRLGPYSKLVWIQTLWHESETIQEILATEGSDWETIRIPAIADSPDDPLGRRIGEPMISARGQRDWKKIRRDVGEYVFAALYQQRPAPAEGNIFKRLWWRYWTPAQQLGMSSPRLNLGSQTILLGDCWRFATVDLANSTKTSGDWTVISAWALTPARHLVLLDRARAHIGEQDHFTHARPLVERWRLDTLFVEKSQYGTTLVKEATQAGIPISPLEADTDKLTRALPASTWCSNGRVWLPAGAWWLKEWTDEAAGFPNGSHDDQVDTLAYAVRVGVAQWSPASPRELPPQHMAATSPVIEEPDPGIDFMREPL